MATLVLTLVLSVAAASLPVVATAALRLRTGPSVTVIAAAAAGVTVAAWAVDTAVPGAIVWSVLSVALVLGVVAASARTKRASPDHT